jgi:hypothetical protein
MAFLHSNWRLLRCVSPEVAHSAIVRFALRHSPELEELRTGEGWPIAAHGFKPRMVDAAAVAASLQLDRVANVARTPSYWVTSLSFCTVRCRAPPSWPS